MRRRGGREPGPALKAGRQRQLSEPPTLERRSANGTAGASFRFGRSPVSLTFAGIRRLAAVDGRLRRFEGCSSPPNPSRKLKEPPPPKNHDGAVVAGLTAYTHAKKNFVRILSTGPSSRHPPQTGTSREVMSANPHTTIWSSARCRPGRWPRQWAGRIRWRSTLMASRPKQKRLTSLLAQFAAEELGPQAMPVDWVCNWIEQGRSVNDMHAYVADRFEPLSRSWLSRCIHALGPTAGARIRLARASARPMSKLHQALVVPVNCRPH